MSAPIVLMDEPDEGYCDTLGWVEAIVSEGNARDLLAEFCVDEDGETPFRPTGPAEKVTLRCRNPAAEEECKRWVPCSTTAKTGAEFWQIVVA